MALDGLGVLVADEAAERESPTPEPRLGLTGDTHPAIGRVLELVREQLEMDVAFVRELWGSAEIVYDVAGDTSTLGIGPDATIVLPEAGSIGTAIDVPVRFSDGTLYGTLSVRSRSRIPPISDRDIRFMRIIAGVIGDRIEQERAHDDLVEVRRARIRHVVRGRHELVIVFQPIVDLRTGRVAGCEALSRFMFPPHRSPDLWFKEAWSVGLGMDLELTALRRAFQLLPSIAKDIYVSINVSPRAITSPLLADAIPEAAADRLVFELTEHERVDDYPALAEALLSFRRRGVRLAIDDTGAGFASLQHVLRLTPQIIKLDVSLTHSLDTDPKRWALAESLLHFGDRIGATVVAEGIESRSDLETLKLIGFRYGQGRALAGPTLPPMPSRVGLE